MTLQDDYLLESGCQRLLILHGHRFDDFIVLPAELAGRLRLPPLEWVDASHRVAKLAQSGSKIFLRCARKIEARAIALAPAVGLVPL